MCEVNEAIVLSFINLKGGVGKTSSAINIADELSKNYKVLVIDMDPQFNATQSLLNHQLTDYSHYVQKDLIKSVEEDYQKEYEVGSGEDIPEKLNIKSQIVYQKLKEKQITAKSLFSRSNIVEESANPDLIYGIKENLSLIPGDLDLFQTLNGDTAGKHNVLHDHFKKHELTKKYEFIIVDCPPNWTILTQASLFASDFYIIPSKIDLFSSIGISLLESLVKSTFYDKNSSLYSTYSMFRKELNKDSLKPLGILFTLTHNMVISNTLKSKLKNEIQTLQFFDSEIPYHSSVPLKFSLYSEVGDKHASLSNSLEKVVVEIQAKINREKSGDE